MPTVMRTLLMVCHKQIEVFRSAPMPDVLEAGLTVGATQPGSMQEVLSPLRKQDAVLRPADSVHARS